MAKARRCILLILTCLSFVFISFVDADQKKLKVHFVSVGYGDAIFIEFPDDTNMLIDAGDRDGAAQLIGYLKLLKVYKIDTVMITQPKKEHFEGLLSLVRKLRIERVLINGDDNSDQGYDELFKLFYKYQIPVRTIKRGSSLNVASKGIDFKILNPENLNATPNGNSIVSWIRYNKVSIVLMADIERAQQQALLELYPEINETNVLQVPHHGSTMIDALYDLPDKTSYIMSTGKNEWGIPWEDDLKKFKGAVYRTDKMGTILVETDGEKVSIIPRGLVVDKPPQKEKIKNKVPEKEMSAQPLNLKKE